jgi:hypothetical protein
VGTLNGQHWRAVRRYFDAAYTHDASLHMMPSFQKEVTKWLDALKNDPARAGVDRLVVHAPTSCRTLPLRVIPQSFYGEAYDEDVRSPSRMILLGANDNGRLMQRLFALANFRDRR